jgi:hypothetical protein
MSAEMQKFIEKWRGQTGKEAGNLQPFLMELCDALGLQRPGASEPGAEYCFEYSVPTVNEDGAAVTDEIDLYKKGHFILEGKQTSEAVRKAMGAAVGGAMGGAARAMGGSAAKDRTMGGAERGEGRGARRPPPTTRPSQRPSARL